MRPTLSPFLLLTLTACATIGAEPEYLVDNPTYRASGSPTWQVEIGDDIALRLGRDHFDHGYTLFAIYRYPAVQARHHGEVRRWHSRFGGRSILVEAHPGPCTTPSGQVRRDRVRVVHFKGEWQGCGEPWSGVSSS